jgi:hypothetical protein
MGGQPTASSVPARQGDPTGSSVPIQQPSPEAPHGMVPLARQTPELPARSPGVVVGARQPQPPGLTGLDAIGVPVRPSLIGSGPSSQGGVRSIPSLQMQPQLPQIPSRPADLRPSPSPITNDLVRTPVTMEVHLPEKPTVIGPGPDGGSSMPQLSAVPPSGAVVSPDEMACLDAFDGLPSSDQARVFEDGHLGGYQFAQAVAHDLRNGFASSASRGVGWLLATFPSGSAELRDFCAAVRGVVGTHEAIAPSGAPFATAVKGGYNGLTTGFTKTTDAPLAVHTAGVDDTTVPNPFVSDRWTFVEPADCFRRATSAMTPAVLAEALSRSSLGRDPYIAAALPALRAGSAEVRAQIVDLVVNGIYSKVISAQTEHEFCVQAAAMGYDGGAAYLGLPNLMSPRHGAPGKAATHPLQSGTATFKGAGAPSSRSGRGFAPSGAPFATAVKGGTLPFLATPSALQVFKHPSDDTLAPPVGYREDAATAVACLDDLARRRILYPDVDHLVRAILSSGLFPSGQTDRRILGTESPESASPFEGLVLLRSAAEQAVARRNVVVTQRSVADEMNRLTDFIYRYLRAGLASRNASIRDAYTRIVLDTCRWLRGIGQTARPAGAPLVASGPVLNDTDARAIFASLSPGAQIAVLRGLAFRGDAYASSLANALAQGRVEVDGFPITTLLFAHVDRAYPARNDPRRILFAYSTGLAARSEGILVTPAGDPPPATPATTTPTPPIAPAEFLAAAGINADQWSQILARSPETAAQMWTEYQRRPSTFAQVSQLILQAADAVLRGLHQSATDQLAAQQAQYAHQQAMATAAVQQAQANANAAQQLLGLTAAQPTQQTVTAPIVTQPAPTTAQAPSEPMSTGTKVAIGGAAVAALGGLAYVATRPKRKSNSKQGRKQRRHKRSGRRAA